MTDVILDPWLLFSVMYGWLERSPGQDVIWFDLIQLTNNHPLIFEWCSSALEKWILGVIGGMVTNPQMHRYLYLIIVIRFDGIKLHWVSVQYVAVLISLYFQAGFHESVYSRNICEATLVPRIPTLFLCSWGNRN